jgi:hypothetical protein
MRDATTDPWDGLSRMIEEGKQRQERDADAFANLDTDACMLCDAYGADKRSLFIDCFYAVYEVVPEALDIRGVEHERGQGYYLLICKSCRSRLLAKLQAWGDECRALRGLPKDHDGDLEYVNPERNIPVRVNGAIEWLTQEEWHARADALTATASGVGDATIVGPHRQQ